MPDLFGRMGTRSLRGFSWNCQAFQHHEPNKARQKRDFVTKHLQHCHVGCLQEVHGSDFEFRNRLSNISGVFDLKYSACNDTTAGGVATVWRKDVARGATVSHQELVPGRILRSVFVWDENTGPLEIAADSEDPDSHT
eukprot:6790430-Karenia_brevis.AAC.1